MTLPTEVTTPSLQPYSNADYTGAFQAHLPRGRAWPRNAGSLQSAVVAALVPTYQRNDAAACALIADIFPPTTGDLLPDWELSLGLPDPCQGTAPTIAARVAQVVARFVGGGSPTIAYFTAYAATLGFTATITQFTPWRFGQSMGKPLYSDQWAFVWQADVGTSATTPAEVVVCEFQRLAPAHTMVVVTVEGIVVGASPAPTPTTPSPRPFVLDSSALDGPNILS